MAKIMISGNRFAKLIFIHFVNLVLLLLDFSCKSINIFYIYFIQFIENKIKFKLIL